MEEIRSIRRCDEFFLSSISWGLAGILFLAQARTRYIYYQLLPADYNPSSGAMAEYLGREALLTQAQPKYQLNKYTRGYGSIRRWLYGTTRSCATSNENNGIE